MSKRRNWTKDELLLAINLYCKIPFGRIHSQNPKIIELAIKAPTIYFVGYNFLKR